MYVHRPSRVDGCTRATVSLLVYKVPSRNLTTYIACRSLKYSMRGTVSGPHPSRVLSLRTYERTCDTLYKH